MVPAGLQFINHCSVNNLSLNNEIEERIAHGHIDCQPLASCRQLGRYLALHVDSKRLLQMLIFLLERLFLFPDIS